MAQSIRAYKQEQAILSGNPELRELVRDVNSINQTISKMLKSEYFRGISLPETIDKLSILKQAELEPESVKESIVSIKGELSRIWEERRIPDAVQQATGLAKTGSDYVKTLKVMPESATKRSSRTGRGTLSDKAVKNIIADDITMLKRLTGKSENEIMEFLNAWFENVEVSGSQTLTDFVKAVYKRDYAGEGASKIWGSPPPEMAIKKQILEVEDIEPEYTEEFEESYEVEESMDSTLYDKWMNLFS